MNKNNPRNPRKGRLSTLLLLVFFVFIILLVSIVISGLISHILFVIGILPSLFTGRQPSIFIFMLLVSLFIGSVLAAIGGDYFLRPLHNLIDATKEIASGNFDVRVDAGGSKEIERLEESFNEMAKELSSIEILRADFVSTISHEFKTPTASIMGFAKRLKRNSLTNEQRDEYLDIIISESERLTRLSGNVLLLSKLESTDMNTERAPYFLDEQIRRTILLLEPQLHKKQLDVDVSLETVQITANEEMLHHLWINLLGNAVKFSPEGGVIAVTLKKEENNALISISDEGLGMDDEVKKHIFKKFYQSDKSRATEGNGLGLSIVKRIVELENGRIAVTSKSGGGTCFTVYLPAE